MTTLMISCKQEFGKESLKGHDRQADMKSISTND